MSQRETRVLIGSIWLTALSTAWSPITLPARAQDAPTGASSGISAIETYKPSYLAVSELLTLLGTREIGGRLTADIWRDGSLHSIDVRSVETANQLVLSGDPADLAAAKALLTAVDLAPRQIEIETTIVEVNRSLAQNLGIDWERIWDSTNLRIDGTRQDNEVSDLMRDGADDPSPTIRYSERETDDLRMNVSTELTHGLRLLDQSGAGRVRSTPKLLTLNNRPASIMDGQRVTYVDRSSPYVDFYEAQTLDAGLKLEVTPTLGEAGVLSLRVRAELTELIYPNGGATPAKDGQMIENTVIAKDGIPVLLGGFQRRVDVRKSKRLPILGHLMPFLFTREETDRQVWDSYLVLTARVVEPGAPLGEGVREEIEPFEPNVGKAPPFSE